jgi:hypothetical protein
MIYLGERLVDSTVYIPFNTFNSSGASVTLTGLAVTDIEVYKDGSVTQRASDAGYTLLDTDGIDFDGITGLHGFKIDLSDNTTAGFWAAGSHYMVAVSAVTVDGQTVNFWAASFDIIAEGATLADINAEFVDVLRTDTTGEPAQGAPPTTATPQYKLDFIYKCLRNKTDETATLLRVFADDGTTVDHKATVSDDGTTFVKGEIVAGP